MTVFIILILGFILLIKGADFLVAGSSALAKRIGVSDLVIGLTVVAFGTSMPELLVNIFASAEGNTEIAIGNVIGSNLFNILLILGVSALIYPLAITRGTAWKEIPFSLLAVAVLGFLSNDIFFGQAKNSALTRIDGFVFLSFFAIFLYYISNISKIENGQQSQGQGVTFFKAFVMVIGGLIALILGGKIVVDGAVKIALQLGISQSLIGLTIVAAGTSLPELATSAVAAYKKNADIAVGNIVGSNIFNIFLVLGVSAVIKPLPIATSVNSDIFVLTGSTLLLFLFMFTGKRRMIDRWEGGFFVLFYIIYLVFLIKKG